VRDDDVRSACFYALDVLQAQHGPELAYSALAGGFRFRGRPVPFLNRAYGIYRAANVQRGRAALSISSAFAQKRYQDEGTPDGVLGTSSSAGTSSGRSSSGSIRRSSAAPSCPPTAIAARYACSTC
jgi:hypothetical protein